MGINRSREAKEESVSDERFGDHRGDHREYEGRQDQPSRRE